MGVGMGSGARSPRSPPNLLVMEEGIERIGDGNEAESGERGSERRRGQVEGWDAAAREK